MRILFISHSYPPIIGGVETHNYELFNALSKIVDCRLVANRNRRFIPFFMSYATLYALLFKKKYDVLLLGTGLLGIVGWMVKKCVKKPVVAVTHGLDLTYNKAIYQKLWVCRFIPSLDKLIAVGKETVKAGIDRGIPEEKFALIPNGINIDAYYGSHSRYELEKILGTDIDGKTLLLSSGRLIKRKGVAWFIRNVLTMFDHSVIYIVAGDGPDKQNIMSSIVDTGQQQRVFMLGPISDLSRNLLYNTCTMLIQPNIKVQGDMEGFGITVLEAASCKLPVIASRLEGLQDAIQHGKNGFLVEPESPEAFFSKIKELMGNESYRKSFGEKARQYVIEKYQWKNIAIRYKEEFEKITSCL
jgi:glycosyltransferase involved in cell wall biosynthesis